VVQDVGEKRAVWVPQEVVIHRSTEMQDGLVFVLENPTDRTHAFAAYGLFEEIMGAGGELTRKAVTGQRDDRKTPSGSRSARRNLKDAQADDAIRRSLSVFLSPAQGGCPSGRDDSCGAVKAASGLSHHSGPSRSTIRCGLAGRPFGTSCGRF
jgi:hypothetical protein